MRDLGSAGENHFSGWCAAAGITANKSVCDHNGWDIFIEYENPANIEDPHTLHEPLVECKIQIKSTDGRKRSVDIPLSNLKKMVTTPLPAFYVLLEFDASEFPTRAFIRHIDNELSGRVLKRIRELASLDKNVKLNKKTMRITFESETEILPLTAAQLKNKIIEIVGKSASRYTSKKQQHLATTGYEDGKYIMRFSIDGESNLEKLVNMSLGSGGKVEIKDVVSSAVRFGIPSDQPDLDSPIATIELTNITPSEFGTITFKHPTKGTTVSFNVALYRSPLDEWLPDSMRKMRLESELLEVHLGRDAKLVNIQIKLEPETMADATEILKIFKLCTILSNPKKVELTLKFVNVKIPLQLNESSGFTDCSYQINLLERLLKIKAAFGHLEPLTTSISEIELQRVKIAKISHILNGGSEMPILNFKLSSGPESNDETHCIIPISLNIGNLLYFSIVALTGKIEKLSEGNYKLFPKECIALYQTTTDAHDIDEEKLVKEIKQVIDTYNPPNICINLLSAFVNSKTNTLFLDREKPKIKE